MTLLLRALGAACVLVAPLLLWHASLQASLRRDIAALAEPGGRAAAQARITAVGRPGVAALIEALGGPAPISAMKLLRSRGGTHGIEALVEALGDDDEDVRHYAVMTLAYIGPDAVPALIETLGDAPVAHVRASAAWALAFTGAAGRDALPALEAALNDGDHDVRLVARFAVQQLAHGNEAFWERVERTRAQAPGKVR